MIARLNEEMHTLLHLATPLLLCYVETRPREAGKEWLLLFKEEGGFELAQKSWEDITALCAGDESVGCAGSVVQGSSQLRVIYLCRCLREVCNQVHANVIMLGSRPPHGPSASN